MNWRWPGACTIRGGLLLYSASLSTLPRGRMMTDRHCCVQAVQSMSAFQIKPSWSEDALQKAVALVAGPITFSMGTGTEGLRRGLFI